MSISRDLPSAGKQTSGYLLSLTIACAGIAFVGIGLDSGLIARAGGNPLDAMDGGGFAAFLLAFAILFSSRLIFWDRAAPGLRQIVRIAITSILVIGLFATLWSVVLVVLPHHSGEVLGLPSFFTGAAALCQIASVLWLLLYRQEPYQHRVT